MNSLLTAKVGSIIFLILGIALIVFRKRIVKLNLKIQYKKAKPREIKELKQAEGIGLKPFLLKFQELCYALFGLVVTGICLQELIIPQAGKYINSFMGLFILSVFAAGATIFLTFVILRPLIWRNVDRHLKKNHPEYYQKAHSPSQRERWELVKSRKQIDDPALRKLQKQALLYMIMLAGLLFFICFFGLYALIKVTS